MILCRITFSCSFVLSALAVVHGQGCSNTCPPINYGQEIPALCEGDFADTFADVAKIYTVCHPSGGRNEFSMEDFRGEGRVTVFANYYTGCNAGRRESGVFAHVAQRFFDLYGERTTFILSLKGGGTCTQWATIYQQDATQLYPESTVEPKEMPLSVDDVNYEIRDDLFTPPFGHPSYVVLDGDLRVRNKFIGPCCGYEDYWGCTADIARSLDGELSGYIDAILAESDFGGNVPTEAVEEMDDGTSEVGCQVGKFSEWSECSVTCGSSTGIHFRWRTIEGPQPSECPAPIETKSCFSNTSCGDESDSCLPEFGQSYAIQTVASGFNSPRDVAFHPTPGFHLGEYSEGRQFFPNVGEEAWVVNGGNHSVSIVASLGTEPQTTISRRDRGYVHYMINGTALAFNAVSSSNRSPDRDSFNYWAICNDNLNTYLDAKEPNYFMGPTLYNSNPRDRNLVNRLGDVCKEEEPCYFLHSDMLHESPACIGIAHDPETATAYGNVYWAFDATGSRQTGELVRFDFQQPHGPGSMDHSIAAIRRYVEVELERGPPGVHAGMIVHEGRREIYIAVPGANKVIVIGADSGQFARTAREEYPIFSNRLPSFEYSIWECVDQKDFATGIEMPTGLALSSDGDRIFVAERNTGKIIVYEVSSGSFLYSMSTDFKTIGGLAFSPVSNILHFVDDETNTLNSVKPDAECSNPVKSRMNPNFSAAVTEAKESMGETFSLLRDYQCVVNPVIPNSTLFDQEHDDSGYADENPDVQSVMSGVDETAALLANRTDCEPDSELNFDALLLGGFFCHQCLPEQDLTCDAGGICSNVQWRGYVCDNEFFISQVEGVVKFQTANGVDVDPSSILLKNGVTYRFTVLGDITVCISTNSDGSECVFKGPLIMAVNKMLPRDVTFTVDGSISFSLAVDEEDKAEEAEEAKAGLSSGAITGLVIASIVCVALGVFAIRKCAHDHELRK